jgi:hypothetical protein
MIRMNPQPKVMKIIDCPEAVDLPDRKCRRNEDGND